MGASIAKPIATATLGRVVREGVKSGSKGAVKGIVRGTKSVKKGFKSAGESLERGVGGIREVGTNIGKIGDSVKLFKQMGSGTGGALKQGGVVASNLFTRGAYIVVAVSNSGVSSNFIFCLHNISLIKLYPLLCSPLLAIPII